MNNDISVKRAIQPQTSVSFDMFSTIFGMLPMKTASKKAGVIYLIIGLKITGTEMSAPLVISSHPLVIPKIQANKITSANANTTKETVPASNRTLQTLSAT